MPGIFRAGARALALLLFLALPLAAIAGDSQVRPDCRTLFTSELVGTSTAVTSTAYVQLGQAKDISLAVRATPGISAPDYTVSVVTSLDESTYALPETGATVGTFTDTATHIVAISVPFCKGMKVVLLNNSGSTTVTFDATICSQ